MIDIMFGLLMLVKFDKYNSRLGPLRFPKIWTHSMMTPGQDVPVGEAPSRLVRTRHELDA